jgi:hypothetical protein
MDLRCLLQNSFTLLHVDEIRTSGKTPMGSMAGYRDSFTLYYVDDVYTSQEAHHGFQGLLLYFTLFGSKYISLGDSGH